MLTCYSCSGFQHWVVEMSRRYCAVPYYVQVEDSRLSVLATAAGLHVQDSTTKQHKCTEMMKCKYAVHNFTEAEDIRGQLIELPCGWLVRLRVIEAPRVNFDPRVAQLSWQLRLNSASLSPRQAPRNLHQLFALTLLFLLKILSILNISSCFFSYFFISSYVSSFCANKCIEAQVQAASPGSKTHITWETSQYTLGCVLFAG